MTTRMTRWQYGASNVATEATWRTDAQLVQAKSGATSVTAILSTSPATAQVNKIIRSVILRTCQERIYLTLETVELYIREVGAVLEDHEVVGRDRLMRVEILITSNIRNNILPLGEEDSREVTEVLIIEEIEAATRAIIIIKSVIINKRQE